MMTAESMLSKCQFYEPLWFYFFSFSYFRLIFIIIVFSFFQCAYTEELCDMTTTHLDLSLYHSSREEPVVLNEHETLLGDIGC